MAHSIGRERDVSRGANRETITIYTRYERNDLTRDIDGQIERHIEDVRKSSRKKKRELQTDRTVETYRGGEKNRKSERSGQIHAHACRERDKYKHNLPK